MNRPPARLPLEIPFVAGMHLVSRRLALLCWKRAALDFLGLLLIIMGCSGPIKPKLPAGGADPTPTRSRPIVHLTSVSSPSVLTPSPTALPQLDQPILWYLRGSAPPELSLVTDRLNQLLAERGFNARVEMRPVDRVEFNTRMAERQANGDTWDLVSLPGQSFTAWVERGDLLPLSAYTDPNSGQPVDLLAKRAPGLWSSLPLVDWEAVRRSGIIYAIPNQGRWVQPCGISIRADVVRALALQPDLERIQSFADLTPLLVKIQSALQDGTLANKGVANAKSIRAVVGNADLLLPENAGYDLLAAPFAVHFDDQQAQPVNWFRSTEFAALASLRRSWQQAGYLPNDPLTPPQLADAFRNGNYVVEVGHQTSPGSTLDQADHYGYEWIDRPLAPAFVSTGTVRSSLTGINGRIAGDSIRVERVLLLVDWLHTDPEIYNLLAYGVESRHWTWVDRAERQIALAQASAYLPDYVDQLGDQTLSYAAAAGQVGGWASVRQLNTSSPASVVLGFTFDPRLVSAESAAVQGLLPELLDPLSNGQLRSVDQAAERLAKSLDDAGAPAIQAELSRQLAAWRKR